MKTTTQGSNRNDGWRATQVRSLFLVAFLLMATQAAFAEALPCTVDGNPPSVDIPITVTAQSQIPLFVVCNNVTSLPATLSVTLTEFWGDGGSAHVDLLVPPDYKPPQGNSPVNVATSSIVPLRISVQNFRTTGKYAGRLILAAANKDPLVFKIVLTSAPPAGMLVVTPQTVTLQVTRPLRGWSPGQEPTFSVNLSDKAQQTQLEGITVQLQQVTKQPEGGFSLGRNAEFTFNDQKIANLEIWPAPQTDPQRAIPAPGHAVIKATLRDMNAGEYNAVLRFQSINSASDDAQKLALTVQIRDSIVWAVFVLIIAVVFSFVATKLVASLRNRYTLLGRIQALRPAWLAEEPSVLAVVWVRAVLKESEDLSRRFWLTGENLIDARVTKVAAVIGILDRVRRLREQVMRPGQLPRLPRVRALASLGQIVARLEGGVPDDATLNDISADLKNFELWLQPATLNDSYWASISAAIISFRRDLSLDDVQDVTAKAAMTELDMLLRSSLLQKPADLDGMMSAERNYAALKVLWEWHATAEFQRLFNLVEPQAQAAPDGGAQPAVRQIDDSVLKNLFDVSDHIAWQRIKDAAAKDTLRIVVPATGDSDQIQAYDPIRFDIQTDDVILARTYLFRHALEFQWTFVLNYTRTWMKIKSTPRVMSWKPRSTEPRIVQYTPRGGNLSAAVQIEKYGEVVKFPSVAGTEQELRIVGSSDFGTFRGLAKVEVISWALAAVVAVVTGLSTFYFKGPTFGSFQDYLSIFLWGAGVDQGKNFLQTLQVYSPNS